MKDQLDDMTYRKRQREELFLQWLFCIVSVGFLLVAIILDMPLFITLLELIISIVVGAISLMYGFSRHHRQEHKQLYDMLVECREQKQKDAEPGSDYCATRSV